MKKIWLGLLFAVSFAQADVLSEELTVEQAERVVTTLKDRVVGTLHIGELYVYIRALMTLYENGRSIDPSNPVEVVSGPSTEASITTVSPTMVNDSSDNLPTRSGK